jgi:hypothetical protein
VRELLLEGHALGDLFKTGDGPVIVPARQIEGRLTQVLSATGKSFITEPVARLDITFEGIAGDHHAGMTRRAGGREPWYKRGTEMRNERQLSIVADDELAAIASAMGLPEVKPEWIGANLVISGIPHLSMLPPRTLLFIDGVTLKVDGQNAPCRSAGGGIARHIGAADPDAVALEFTRKAKRLRGLVAWVEKPGVIETDMAVKARLPEQWIYP